MMRASFAAGLAVLLAGLQAGCFKAEVTPPEQIIIGGREVYAPPPPADIAPANPNDQADLARENQQLRDRVTWLQQQDERLSRKYRDQEKDMADIRADMAKIQAQTNEYRREAQP